MSIFTTNVLRGLKLNGYSNRAGGWMTNGGRSLKNSAAVGPGEGPDLKEEFGASLFQAASSSGLCIAARLLLLDPKVLLMDEPASALEIRFRHRKIEEILNLPKLKTQLHQNLIVDA